MENLNLSSIESKNYDYLGMAASLFCGIHCLLTPLAIMYLPKVGEYFESPWVHSTFILLICPEMGFAFVKSFLLIAIL